MEEPATQGWLGSIEPSLFQDQGSAFEPYGYFSKCTPVIPEDFLASGTLGVDDKHVSSCFIKCALNSTRKREWRHLCWVLALSPLVHSCLVKGGQS